jgi:hypothetical protein
MAKDNAADRARKQTKAAKKGVDESQRTNCHKTKAERLKERQKLIKDAEKKAMEPGVAGTPQAIKLKNAANRLRMNNKSVERACLAQNVYDDPNVKGPCLPQNVYDGPEAPKAPEGWKRVKDFSTEEDKKNGFHAALYESDIDGTKVLVFEGTEMSSWQDWKTNLQQGMGMETYQYTRAMKIAKDMKKIHGSNLEIAGHSLGGGLASAAAGVTGLKTSTFNSAGLHPNTVKRQGGSIETANKSVTSRYVKGEILTMAQLYGEIPLKGITFAAVNALFGPIWGSIAALVVPNIPDAVGNPTPIEPILPGNTVDKHGMEHVIAAIEGEKEKDKATIEQELAK